MSAREAVIFDRLASILLYKCPEFRLRDQRIMGRRASVLEAAPPGNVPCNYVPLCVLGNRDAFEFSKLGARREGLGDRHRHKQFLIRLCALTVSVPYFQIWNPGNVTRPPRCDQAATFRPVQKVMARDALRRMRRGRTLSSAWLLQVPRARRHS